MCFLYFFCFCHCLSSQHGIVLYQHEISYIHVFNCHFSSALLLPHLNLMSFHEERRSIFTLSDYNCVLWLNNIFPHHISSSHFTLLISLTPQKAVRPGFTVHVAERCFVGCVH